MEQRTRNLNNPSTTEENDSFPIPKEPLRSISSTNKPKRSSMHSNNSGITSPFAFYRTPVLSPATATETSTPHPSSSQQAQTDQLSPREHLNPIQQFICNSATRLAKNSIKSQSKEPKYNRLQLNYPDSQSLLRTITRQGFNLLPFLYYCQIFLTLLLHAPLFSTRDYCFQLFPDYLEHDDYDSLMWTIQLTFCSLIQLLIYISYNFYKKLQKSPKIFLFVVQFQRRKPHSKLLHMTIKRQPRAKKPPTTDRAEQLALIRGSRPTLPTASAALFLLPQTRSKKTGKKFFCYGWSTLHSQPHKPRTEQTRAPPLPAEI